MAKTLKQRSYIDLLWGYIDPNNELTVIKGIPASAFVENTMVLKANAYYSENLSGLKDG
jgi:hypothetical protein